MSYTKLFLSYRFFARYKAFLQLTKKMRKSCTNIFGHFVSNKKCTLHRINGMPDHLHLLVEIHPSMAVADFCKNSLKNASHKWLEHHSELFS
ncbi:transposase [Actinobacillus pleuropneumoniae]|uniref:transposase n=1 Tax=Actinobacillus pleuropneumoniae TaxID=715 RepID=UPI00201CB5FF|nr:transposase [Actinobacillus pleuropneumoniae]UQZ25749.1 transposase [Actinobacillus pleuropneumoniae]